MKLLAVETATRYQSVALMDEAVLLAEKNQENCASHASSLVPVIQDLLTSLSCPFSAIEGLAVSAGPGSFTGLRVGLSTVVGFRTVTGLPLVTVPTLEAMAWSHRSSGHPVCPVLIARTDEVYWAQFQWENGHAVRILEDRVGTIQDMMDSIRRPTVLFGEGWLRHRRRPHGQVGWYGDWWGAGIDEPVRLPRRAGEFGRVSHREIRRLPYLAALCSTLGCGSPMGSQKTTARRRDDSTMVTRTSARPGFDIRPFQARDLDDVLAIELESFSEPWTRSMFKAELQGNPFGRFLGAFLSGEGPSAKPLIGYICYWVVF